MKVNDGAPGEPQRTGMSRNQFIKRAGALGISVSGAAALLAACGDDDEGGATTASAPQGSGMDALKGTGEAVVCTWGGAYTKAQKEALFDPFTKDTGIGVTPTGSPDAAKMKAMAQTGNVQWDLVDAEGQMMYAAIDDDLLVPIDYALVHEVVPEKDLIADSLTEYGFPSIAFGWVLAWNSETFAEAPQSWADLWDVEKFAGRRALYAQPKPALEVALLADGVAKEDLYPLDVDRAFTKLDELKPHVDVFYEDLGQVDPMLQNNEVDLILTSSGRVHAVKDAGVAVDYTYQDAGWEQGYWVVMADSPNPENAMKLIAYSALPEPQAKFGDLFAYGGPNTKSYDMMKPAVAASLPTAPENRDLVFQVDTRWWTDNLEEVNTRWLDWMQS